MAVRHWLLALAVGAAPSVSALADPPAPTVLHLSQTAQRRLTRDVLHIDLRAEKTGPDPQTVQAAINQAMTKALAEARAVNNIDIETGTYSVYHNEMQQQWSGSQMLMLSGTDSDALVKLAASLQTQGLAMSRMVYEASPKIIRGAENELTNEALVGLEKRAVAVAQQLHTSVVGYRDLNVGNAQTESGPTPRFLAVETAQAAPVPPPAAVAGEATVRVTVSAEILLAPRQP